MGRHGGLAAAVGSDVGGPVGSCLRVGPPPDPRSAARVRDRRRPDRGGGAAHQRDHRRPVRPPPDPGSRRCGPGGDPPSPRDDLSPTHPLRGPDQPGGAVRSRGGRRARPARRSTLAGRDPSLGVAVVDGAHRGHGGGRQLGLRGARLGRLLGMGRRREHLTAPVAGRDGLPPRVDRRPVRRPVGSLERRAGHAAVRPDRTRHVRHPVGGHPLGARLRRVTFGGAAAAVAAGRPGGGGGLDAGAPSTSARWLADPIGVTTGAAPAGEQRLPRLGDRGGGDRDELSGRLSRRQRRRNARGTPLLHCDAGARNDRGTRGDGLGVSSAPGASDRRFRCRGGGGARPGAGSALTPHPGLLRRRRLHGRVGGRCAGPIPEITGGSDRPPRRGTGHDRRGGLGPRGRRSRSPHRRRHVDPRSLCAAPGGRGRR